MKEFRIFYIILVVVSLVMSFVYQSRLMPVIFVILILCPVLSLIVLIINRLALEVGISPDELVTEKYEDGAVVISLKNKFIFPISPVRLTGSFQGAGERGISEKTLLADVAPFTSVTLNLPFSMPYRGEYVMRLEKAELFDIFKLFKLTKKLNKPVIIAVLPREIHLNSLNDINETETENARSAFSLFNKDTFSSLREYREGDNPRHIHWKLSAKQDGLIIKQMEQSVNNSAVIYCDFTAYPEFETPAYNTAENPNTRKNKSKRKKRKGYQERDNISARDFSAAPEAGETLFKVTDNVIEAALALTRRIVTDNNSVKVYWQNHRVNEEYLADNYNSFRALFYEFAVLKAGASEKPFHELLEFFRSGDKDRVIYIITPCLNKKLLETLEALGYAVRRDVVLILLDYIKNPPSLLDYVMNETKINVKLINENNINTGIS